MPADCSDPRPVETMAPRRPGLPVPSPRSYSLPMLQCALTLPSFAAFLKVSTAAVESFGPPSPRYFNQAEIGQRFSLALRRRRGRAKA
jgi:hypothetical protein